VRELLVVGNISRDTSVASDGTVRHAWGGGALNVGVGAAGAGARPRLVSVVGGDAATLLPRLSAWCKTRSVHLVPNETTCAFTLRYDADGNVEHVESMFGAAIALTEHALAEVQVVDPSAAHCHVCCRTPLDAAPLLARLRDRRLQFSVDFAPGSIASVLESAADVVVDAAVVFVTAREEQVLRRRLPDQRLRELVVTNGPDPVRVTHTGGAQLSIEVPRTDAVEVTGAGDVFAGCYLARRLLGHGPGDAAAAAVHSAAASVRAMGALHCVDVSREEGVAA
jgi:sugar/nucleoside kinase (ribokinase family)